LQLNVTNSPFSQGQTEQLNQLLPTLTETQKIWLTGYLTAPGLPASEKGKETESVSGNTDGMPAQAVTEAKLREVTVLYGSETGNAQMLAEEMVGKLENKELKVKLSALDDFKPKDLKKVEDLLIITATHGEGDPPDNAISFYEVLHSRKAPKLEDLRFSVLSLGDESYEFFCQSGKDFDKRLEELGGERLHTRVDCDLDFEDPAAEWMEKVLAEMANTQAISQEPSITVEAESGTAETSIYSKSNPFKAEVLEKVNLNGRGSNKETHHIELSLEDSNLSFEPGDSLGILPQNDPALVDELIKEMNWDPDETVQINKQGEIRSLREALISHFEITVLTKPLLEKAGAIFENEALNELLDPENAEERKAYTEGRDMIDLLRDYPSKELSPDDFIQILRKLPTRLYSIASSYNASPDEVQLTVSTVKYHSYGREREGVCSVQLADRIEPGEELPVYIHRNPNFKLPAEEDAPVIMIGPGTGVAPFRSFLEEQEELDTDRKTWLFFGDQHFDSDFLYQVDWQRWLKDGVLTRMDVAFSRDTDEKVYVQHRMLESSKDFYQWLTEGAYIYVCGDEKKMASDVQNALLTILEQEGNMSHEQAEDYLNDLRRQKRYQRDVY